MFGPDREEGSLLRDAEGQGLRSEERSEMGEAGRHPGRPPQQLLVAGLTEGLLGRGVSELLFKLHSV